MNIEYKFLYKKKFYFFSILFIILFFYLFNTNKKEKCISVIDKEGNPLAFISVSFINGNESLSLNPIGKNIGFTDKNGKICIKSYDNFNTFNNHYRFGLSKNEKIYLSYTSIPKIVILKNHSK